MAVLSRTRSGGPILSGGDDSLRRSSTPTTRAPSPPPFASSSASAFASSSSAGAASFVSSSSGASFFRRPVSPTRIHLLVPPRSAPHPARSVSVADRHLNRRRGGGDGAGAAHPKTCLCSPTTHPGSFRCSLHKGYAAPPHGGGGGGRGGSVSAQLNMRRSAMANSLVRIGAVEGEWVRRALTAPIRPSSHQLRRRAAYQPRPSRLSTMSAAEGADL
ncbi:uncharacterized protein LOC109704737 [Ananas comosus]|uniref:Uncharacterized protein LOC109704737 n=1 Tax=Ananas comosus TaxID=4615 RepID=A0A6P5EI43_ANACO|nr:uncharacterized protein LOC109704737 [Ananas comosus]